MSEDAPIHRFTHEAMATFFEVMIAGQTQTYARQAAQAAFDEFDRMERLLSRFDPSSEISQIAKLRPGQSLPVSHEVFQCLSIARYVFDETAGIFDPTIGPLMRCWRGEGGARLEPSPGKLDAALARVGMNRLTLCAQPHLFGVHLNENENPSAGPLELDLGAIGKGYALDRALEVLRDWEIGNALLHSGTSTAIAIGDGPASESEPPPRGWRVSMGGINQFTLRDLAVSGSGTEVKGEHILDPRTGNPARRAAAAWALCPSATLSDALSTAFIMMPADRIEAFCAAHPDVSACIVPEGNNPQPQFFGRFFNH